MYDEVSAAISEAVQIYNTGRQIYDWVNSVSGALVSHTERLFPGSTAKTHKVWAQEHSPARRWAQRVTPRPRRALTFFTPYKRAGWRYRRRRRNRRRRYY